MADIISFEGKHRLSKDKKAEIIRKQKILAVQKVFQCTQCAFKCKKCGTQINPDCPQQENRKLNVPYAFCESCAEEYLDYIERLKGGGNPDSYWHNEDWLDLWKTWIDYQSAIDRYLKSKEFMHLMQELRQSAGEE